jgi:hypothetical protein
MASISFDQVAADAMLKQMYDVPAMVDLSYSDRPFFALVNKRGGEGGNGVKIPLAIATSQGFAPTVAQAQAVLASQDLEAFTVTPVVLLSVARISGLTLESSMTSKQAFAKGAKMVIDAAVKRLANGVSSGLFRDGSGAIGTLAAAGSNLVAGIVKLSNDADSVQFELNQAIQKITSAGVLNATILYVVAVNRNSGTITLSTSLGGAASDVSTIFTSVGNDKIITAGTLNLQVKGLSSWLTSTGLATAFYGVDRSKDPQRLAGIVYDGSTLSVKDAIINAINRVAREGGKPDYVFMNFESYTQLAQDLQSNVIYTQLALEGPGKISFSGFRFQGPKGEVIVVPDRDCEPKTAYLLQLDSWMLLHANEGEPVFLDDNGVGQVFRTVESYDGREVRVKFYGNLACNAPGYNAKVSLSA